MTWFAWVFRRRERDRAYSEFKRLTEEYAEQGGRIISLSARTELLRKSTGSTQKSLEYVEKSFAVATERYSNVQSILQSLAAELGRGRDHGLRAARESVSGLVPALDELERHLKAWEVRWQEAPAELEQAEASLENLRRDLARCESVLQTVLPPRAGLESLSAYLLKARQTLLAGNPVEASHQVRDFALARTKIESEIGSYRSGVGAVEEVEAALTRLRTGSTAHGGAILALTAAEELLPRLKKALAKGEFGPFQAELLQTRNWLAQATVQE